MFNSILAMFNPNSIVEMSEDERVAFYGVMCAIGGVEFNKSHHIIQLNSIVLNWHEPKFTK
jgi:hypothetical protein